MKHLIWNGSGPLVVPGHFTLAPGEGRDIDDHLAEALVNANPREPLAIIDLPAKRGAPKRRLDEEPQPEAQEGEGQPTASDTKEE